MNIFFLSQLRVPTLFLETVFNHLLTLLIRGGCKLITAVFCSKRVNERGDKHQQQRVLHPFSSPKYVFSVAHWCTYVYVSQYSQISPAAVDNIWGEVNYRETKHRRDEIVIILCFAPQKDTASHFSLWPNLILRLSDQQWVKKHIPSYAYWLYITLIIL